MAEQVRYLYRGSMVSVVNVINALIVAFALSDQVPGALVQPWVLATGIAVLGRVLLALQFERRNPASDDAGKWAFRFTVGAMISGALWGGLCLILVSHGTYADHLLASFVIAGITAGGLGSLAGCYPAYLGYLLTSTIPLAGMCFAQLDSRYVAMGSMVLLYSAVMSLTGRNFNRAIMAALRLKIENTALNKSLSAAQEGLA
jgi:hypothetical protein